MKKQDIQDIESFLNEEICDYDLDYDFEIEDNTMQVIFNGHFTSNKEIEMTFRCISGNVEFYGLCESYIHATTREFWINFMGRIKE